MKKEINFLEGTDYSIKPDASANNENNSQNKEIYGTGNKFLDSKKRIWELDFLRGICIILMIFDHLFFFGCHVFGYALCETPSGQAFVDFCYFYLYDSPRDYIHVVVLFFFFALCGISCSLSRSNLKRGLILSLVATVYSLLSYLISLFAGSDAITNYGVLNFLATCIMIYALAELALKRVPYGKYVLLGLCSLSAIIVLALFYYYTPPSDLPYAFSFLFPTKYFDGLHFIDFKCHSAYAQIDVSPADFFPFIPYAAFFFIGNVMGFTIYRDKKSLLPKLDGNWNIAVNFLGRHTLIVYVIHIVVIALLLEAICFFSTGYGVLF